MFEVERNIEGKRIRLRPATAQDLKDRYRWITTSEIRSHSSGVLQYDDQRMDEELMNLISKIAADFAIETLDGQHIGWCAISDWDEQARRARSDVIIGELSFWGKGYGKEALQLLLRCAFEEMEIRCIWSSVDELHHVGIRLFEQMGFRYDGIQRNAIRDDFGFRNRLIMSMTQKEYAVN